MCYSARSSIAAFLTCSLGSILLVTQNKIIGLFLFYVGFMQIFDYVFWTNHETSEINYITTKLAMLANLLQPLTLMYLILLISGPLGFVSSILSLMYAVCVCAYLVQIWRDVDYTLVRAEHGPGLYWQWVDKDNMGIVFILYLLTICALLYEHFVFPLNIFFVAIFLVSALVTFCLKKTASSFGRFWCNYAAYLTVVYALITIAYDKPFA